MSSPVSRFALLIEYDGSNYAGWQRQKNALTVQEVIENLLTDMAGSPVTLFGASRTDAGVHAEGQVAHFDAELTIPEHKLFIAMNTRLPEDIRIKASAIAPDGFHARYDATGKTYIYRLFNDTHAPAIMRNICTFIPGKLDIHQMQKAAGLFVGTHDFRCTMAAGSNAKTTVRTVHRLDFAENNGFIEMSISGNGFLYNMVRIIAGTLVRVGQHKLSIDEIEQAFAQNDRRLLGFTAPAKGLTLREVHYEQQILTYK